MDTSYFSDSPEWFDPTPEIQALHGSGLLDTDGKREPVRIHVFAPPSGPHEDKCNVSLIWEDPSAVEPMERDAAPSPPSLKQIYLNRAGLELAIASGPRPEPGRLELVLPRPEGT